MANRTPKFGRSVSMPVLQEQNEEAASSPDGTLVPEEQTVTPTPSPGLHGSRQQQQQPAGTWTRNRNGFSNPWASANSTSSVDESKLAQTVRTPQKILLPGLEHRSPIADTPISPKELPTSNGSFLHHRRNSSRTSSYPDTPSPLATELFMRSTFTDGSSLMSPLPELPRSQQPEEDISTTPSKLDLHILKVSANAKGSPYYKPKGFGHSRKITDPFVDNPFVDNPFVDNPFVHKVESEDQSPLPSPFLTQATRKMEHISSIQGRSVESAAWKSPGFATTHNSNGDAATFTPQTFQSNIRQDGFCASTTSSYSPLPTMSPMAPAFKPVVGGSPRVNLPIPPPSLPSVDGHLVMTPTTRARLDARVATRAHWIREEAKTIAALGRLSFVAGQQFEKTGTKEDYEKWQGLVAAYEDATDLEKRQEERRNMFMPKGMRAMKTSPYNVPDDQSASFAVDNEYEEGHLLGFRMAYMERICAEVKRRDEEQKEAEVEKEDDITAEMIDTLSVEEKKELKKHLLARLQTSAEK